MNIFNVIRTAQVQARLATVLVGPTQNVFILTQQVKISLMIKNIMITSAAINCALRVKKLFITQAVIAVLKILSYIKINLTYRQSLTAVAGSTVLYPPMNKL